MTYDIVKPTSNIIYDVICNHMTWHMTLWSLPPTSYMMWFVIIWHDIWHCEACLQHHMSCHMTSTWCHMMLWSLYNIICHVICLQHDVIWSQHDMIMALGGSQKWSHMKSYESAYESYMMLEPPQMTSYEIICSCKSCCYECCFASFLKAGGVIEALWLR